MDYKRILIQFCDAFFSVRYSLVYSNRDSSISIVTRLWGRRPWCDSRQEQGFFISDTTVSRPALGPPGTGGIFSRG
jgi:hypothetical protein